MCRLIKAAVRAKTSSKSSEAFTSSPISVSVERTSAEISSRPCKAVAVDCASVGFMKSTYYIRPRSARRNPALRLVQQHRHAQMLWFALLEQSQQVLQRHSRVQYVFHHNDRFPLDAGVQVPRQTHLPRRVRFFAVARHRNEVKRNFPRNISCQIGQKKDSALQNAHQMQRLASKIFSNFLPPRMNSPLNPPAPN